jgi:hypothetical protein
VNEATHKIAFDGNDRVLALVPIASNIVHKVGMAKDWYACEGRFVDTGTTRVGPDEIVLHLDRLHGVPANLPSRYLAVQRRDFEP